MGSVYRSTKKIKLFVTQTRKNSCVVLLEMIFPTSTKIKEINSYKITNYRITKSNTKIQNHKLKITKLQKH